MARNQDYDHKAIEEKWQAVWEKEGLFQGTLEKIQRKAGGRRKVGQEKLYLLFAFAYPSGSGLHVGHVESKTALDILARYNRMKGKRVFFPVGWDAFGLPAENYAIKTGVHPAVTTKKAIKTFRRQIKRLGISYDWKTEIATSHPEYYKWTQWLFLQLYKKGLAYKAPGMVNWCPSCQTVLANEQVVEGACERCETAVVQKELEQWYFRITKYRDELIEGLEQVDWPEATEQQQKNWIGRKQGARVRFGVQGKGFRTEAWTFTTRVDTVFGVTFLVVSPEKVREWEEQGWKVPVAVAEYVKQAFGKTEEERKIGEKEKTGVDTGLVAINPVNGEEVPVYVADYVLAGYGTGVVMGVPAHDERDFAFARKFGLRIRKVIEVDDEVRSVVLTKSVDSDFEDQVRKAGWKGRRFEDWGYEVVVPADKADKYISLVQRSIKPGPWYVHTDGAVRKVVFREKVFDWKEGKAAKAYADKLRIPREQQDWDDEDNYMFCTERYGVLVNSGEFDGMKSEEAMKVIMAKFEAIEPAVTYRLRDWLISRQRYWGVPIPIVYDPEGKAHPVRDEDLPWKLPEDVEFKPTGESPLVNSKEFVERTEKLYGKGWRPEFDTMDTFVDSSWYFLRFTDARNRREFASGERLAEWLPVDLYMIGPEHIVLHLLYSRFVTKFLRDEGYLCEVVGKMKQSGKAEVKAGLDPEDHEAHVRAGYWCVSEPFSKMRHQGMILGPDHRKMSKSRGNVIDPDEVVEKYGADTLRMYEMFMGPLEADKPWSTESVAGVYRFVKRLRARALGAIEAGREKTREGLVRKLHQSIRKVSEDIPALKFNTAIAALMELVNEWEKPEDMSLEDVGRVVRLVAPLAPFMAEELYQEWRKARGVRGEFESVHQVEWPVWDEGLIDSDRVTVVVQVNGKVRSTLEVLRSKLEAEEAKTEIIDEAKKLEKVAKWLEGKKVVKEIWVASKGKGKQGLVSLVVR